MTPVLRYAVLVSATVAAGMGDVRPAAAQIGDDTRATLVTFIEQHRARSGWPGVAVSIATTDSVVFARGFGEADGEGGPITEDTPFFVGSVTKTFTAFAIVRLVEDGLLALDAPVERYLPSFSLRAPFVPESITLRHLLHHRSGLSQWSGHDGRAQVDGEFGHLAPAGAPGGDAEYSSLNFIILGRVLEAASGMTYGAFLERSLFRPLGMDRAFADDGTTRPRPVAQGHRNYFGLDVRADEPPTPRYLAPAGFVALSAREMGLYTSMLLGGGSHRGTRVLAPESVEALFTPLDGQGPGMAWGRGEVRGTAVLGHAGSARTASARTRLVPERDLAISVMVNSNTGPFFDASAVLLDGIHAILDGEEAPTPWPAERAFKLVILAGTLLSVFGVARSAQVWGRAGYPVGLDGSAGTLGRLAFDVGGAAFLVWGLPRIIGVPLSTLVEYFPDIGLGIAISAGAGVASGVLRGFTRSSGAAGDRLPVPGHG